MQVAIPRWFTFINNSIRFHWAVLIKCGIATDPKPVDIGEYTTITVQLPEAIWGYSVSFCASATRFYIWTRSHQSSTNQKMPMGFYSIPEMIYTPIRQGKVKLRRYGMILSNMLPLPQFYCSSSVNYSARLIFRILIHQTRCFNSQSHWEFLKWSWSSPCILSIYLF